MAGDEALSVYILGEGGTVFKMDLPLPEAIADRLSKGALRRVNEDGSLWSGEDDGVPSLPDKRPTLNANKAEWVGWAVACGSTPDDAEALSKADLIDKYGSIETPPAPPET